MSRFATFGTEALSQLRCGLRLASEEHQPHHGVIDPSKVISRTSEAFGLLTLGVFCFEGS